MLKNWKQFNPRSFQPESKTEKNVLKSGEFLSVKNRNLGNNSMQKKGDLNLKTHIIISSDSHQSVKWDCTKKKRNITNDI